MTEKQKQFFCPVCGELNLETKNGILYCPNCRIFVGKPESFADTVEVANPIAAAQARAGFAPEDFVPSRGIKILAFLIRWVNGFLLSLYGCLVMLYAGFLFMSQAAGANIMVIFGVVYLFFGIFFWKLAADLKTRDRNAWWMAVAIHFISLALIVSGFLNPVDLTREKELVGIVPILTGTLDVFRIVYPVIVIALLVALRKYYLHTTDDES